MVNPRPNPHLFVEAGVIYHDDVVATSDGPKTHTRSIGTVEKDTPGSPRVRWETRSTAGTLVVRGAHTRQEAIEEHDRRYHQARAMGPLR
jgi:hypothetical protein